MYFAKALFVCASLVASTIAQSSNSRIAFTVLPSSMTAGQDITLHWGGGDGSPVTLTLQQGTTNNLKTVLLVKGDATGNSYTWSVPKTLPNGDNYAFRIQQDESEPNYTGMITVTGGSTSSASASSTDASSASSTSASASSTESSGGVIGGGSTGGKNSTAVATASANATTTTLAGTAAGASGTGASMARNTTMSKATLSATTSSASTTSSKPSVGGSGGSPTGSSSTPSSTKTGGAVALVASNFALLVCAIAGVIYLG